MHEDALAWSAGLAAETHWPVSSRQEQEGGVLAYRISYLPMQQCSIVVLLSEFCSVGVLESEK